MSMLKSSVSLAIAQLGRITPYGIGSAVDPQFTGPVLLTKFAWGGKDLIGDPMGQGLMKMLSR